MSVKNLILKPRFKDCDLMGHVNNANYLTYAEEARIFFLNQILPKNWDWNKNGIIVKKHEIIYFEPIFFDQEIEIESKITEINKTSFKLEHILKYQKITKSVITSILVYYNYIDKEKKNLDELILNFINK